MKKINCLLNIFDYKTISAHMIKMTRDAELDLESDLSKSFMEKISDSVKDRQDGEPVRFVYDKTIDNETLEYLMSKMGIATIASYRNAGLFDVLGLSKDIVKDCFVTIFITRYIN